MSVYKIQSSHFNLVEQPDFVGDENRLFYTVDGNLVTFYLSDGQTPGGTQLDLGSGTGGVSQAYVDTSIANAINGLIDGSTGTLDTLNELATAIGNDPNFAVSMANALADKVSFADFETQFDINLATINTDEVAEGVVNLYYTDSRVQDVINSNTNNYITASDIPTNVSAFTNDAGYITIADVPTSSVTSVNGLTGDVVLTTDNITEGTTNLYYSDTLVENYITNNPLTGTDWVVDSLQFTGGTGDQGLLTWNVDEETVNLVMNGTTQHIGQDTFVHVRNNTAGVLEKGTAVMVVGTLGASGRLLVEPMIADGTVLPRYFIGVTSEDIAANTDGMVMTFGKIRQIDTSVWPDGSVLWLDPVANGGLTTTEPEAPNLKIATAFVVSSGNSGTLMVRANPGIDLHNNHRVQIVNPDVYGNPTVAGSTLMWNNTLSRWENRTPAEHLADVLSRSAPVSSVGEPNDTADDVRADANYLYYCTADYDGVTNIWKRVAWSNDTW